jgi:hypothetical protein
MESVMLGIVAPRVPIGGASAVEGGAHQGIPVSRYGFGRDKGDDPRSHKAMMEIRVFYRFMGHGATAQGS